MTDTHISVKVRTDKFCRKLFLSFLLKFHFFLFDNSTGGSYLRGFQSNVVRR